MILGANDFIAKPYNTQVLLTHIQAVLKRSTKGHEQQTLTHGGIALNLGKSVARFKESEVELTKNELRIL
ncbi:MAG: DNA-binding response regulator, partial [Niameybacter sp.]